MSGMSVRSPAKPRRLSRGRGETAWFTARSSIAPSISHMLYEIRRFERLNRRRDRGTRKNEDDCRNLQKAPAIPASAFPSPPSPSAPFISTQEYVWVLRAGTTQRFPPTTGTRIHGRLRGWQPRCPPPLPTCKASIPFIISVPTVIDYRVRWAEEDGDKRLERIHPRRSSMGHRPHGSPVESRHVCTLRYMPSAYLKSH
jgi:hypothetical protein